MYFNLTFRFDYSEEDTEKCILRTEEVIRNLIYEIMNEKYGFNWEFNSKVGFNESEIRSLELRKNREKKQLGNQRSSDRLLDYSYILDLKKIIVKNWSEFSNVFPVREVTLTFFDQIGKYRNPLMHRRQILAHQKRLCIGMCGELLLHIDRWRSGFRRQVDSYYCVFSFSSLPLNGEGEDVKKKSIEKAENWVSKIEKLSRFPYEVKEMKGMGISAEVECKLIKLDEGNILISPPFPMGKYDGEHYYDSIINTHFQNIEILDRLISELGHPYWVLHWLLKEPLNVSRINAERYEQSTGTLEPVKLDDKKKFEDHIDATILNNFNELPLDGIERMKRHEEIRIIAGYSHFTRKRNSIALVFGGRPENSFFRAHSIFTPDSLISILLNELPLRQIRKMIKDSRFTPPKGKIT